MLTIAVPWLAAAALLVGAAATAPEPACLTAGGCDCEAIAARGIRQMANAGSSLALLAAGMWIALRPARARMFGVAVALSGAAAFAYHAVLTGWAATLDGAAVTFVAGTLAAREWHPRIPHRTGLAVAAVATGVSQAVGTTAANLVTAALFAAAVIGHVSSDRLGDLRIAAAALGLIGAGVVIWSLSGTGGVWCRPDSVLQGHGLWHIVAAASAMAVSLYLRSGEAAEPF
jgi:hypothetical protein